MLPEILDSVIKTEVERESLRRNAYATVKELNAFMMKGSGFFDIDGDLRRYSGLHVDVTVIPMKMLQTISPISGLLTGLAVKGKQRSGPSMIKHFL